MKRQKAHVLAQRLKLSCISQTQRAGTKQIDDGEENTKRERTYKLTEAWARELEDADLIATPPGTSRPGQHKRQSWTWKKRAGSMDQPRTPPNKRNNRGKTFI